MGPPLRIGTRGSRLALTQTSMVVDALRPLAQGREIIVTEIRTEGDQHPDAPLSTLGAGTFTSALEQALLDGQVDLAVHSLKDLLVEPTPGLVVVPVLERADPRAEPRTDRRRG